MTKTKAKAAEQTVETEVAADTAVTTAAEVAQGEVTTDTGSVETTGVRARRSFMMKQFLPNPDWINMNVVAGGKGTRAVVGRIFGIATGFERRNNETPDGKIVESIFVKGMFQSEGYVTGEVSEASGVFFPMAYAEKIAAAIEGLGVKNVEVDCDIGLEATGKTIPYEWVVTAFREGQEMDVLRRIKSNRPRPTALVHLPNGEAKQLSLPSA